MRVTFKLHIKTYYVGIEIKLKYGNILSMKLLNI